MDNTDKSSLSSQGQVKLVETLSKFYLIFVLINIMISAVTLRWTHNRTDNLPASTLTETTAKWYHFWQTGFVFMLLKWVAASFLCHFCCCWPPVAIIILPSNSSEAHLIKIYYFAFFTNQALFCSVGR